MNFRLFKLYCETKHELYNVLRELWRQAVLLDDDSGYLIMVAPALAERIRQVLRKDDDA